jgi:hypothetical protein
MQLSFDLSKKVLRFRHQGRFGIIQITEVILKWAMIPLGITGGESLGGVKFSVILDLIIR